MVASSSTFRSDLGQVIRNLFRLLHAVQHGTETLVYSNYPREAAASTSHNLWGIATGVPWFLLSTTVPMQLQHQ